MSAEAPSLAPVLVETLLVKARRLGRQFVALPAGRRALLVSGAVALAVLVYAFARTAARPDEVGEARVRRGSLRITVALAGTLVPARADSYGAEVPGVEMKILELAAEGSRVAPGEVLLRFDEATFRRDLAVAEARTRETRSETEQSRQAMNALLASQGAELADAKAALAKAELDLVTFEKGANPLQLQQSAAAVDRFRREAEDARIKVEGLEPFAAKGYISREELRTAKLRAEQTQADLALAEQQHRTLLEFTQPQALAQRHADVAARASAVATVQARATAQLAQARAAFELTKARAEEARRAEADSHRRLELCTIRARSAGLVVYREVFEKGGERRKIRPGDAIFAGQPVLDLPDLSEMLLEARLRESDIHRVEPGQKAEIRLDAFPDRTFPAEVKKLLALSSGGDRAEARTFPLVLAVTAQDPRLRPGMSGRATIFAGEVADALLVPVDALRYDGDSASVVVKGLTGPVTKKVTTGKSSAFFVEVKDGVAEGDVVLLGAR